MFAPVHLKRTLLIAFVVGTWLNLFNHGDELLHGVINAHLVAKLALNYLTPFVVSNTAWWRTAALIPCGCDGVIPEWVRHLLQKSLAGGFGRHSKNLPRNRFRG